MTGERASIFENEGDLSATFKPKPVVARSGPAVEQVRQVAEVAKFTSREPKVAAEAALPNALATRRDRRHRTGRNVQVNIKVTTEVAEAFLAMCDAEGWVQGVAFEKALAALRREMDKTVPGV